MNILDGLNPISRVNPLAGSVTRATASDPVFKIFQRWQVLVKQQEAVEARSNALRDVLVAKWGDPVMDRTAMARWKRDPRLPDLEQLNGECDRLSFELADVFDEIVEAPTTTVAAIHLKLRVVAWNQHLDLSGLDHHEVQTIKFLREAAQFLDRVQS